MGKALWHINSQKSKLKEIDLVQMENGIEIRSLYSLVSTGTEALIAKGQVGMKFMEHMTVPYMRGDFNLPILYGYSLIGQNVKTGEYVHCMHPHQSHCILSKKDITVLAHDFPLPKAALISNLETVVNAIWDGEVKNGDSILIAGFGNIGCLLAETISQLFKVDLYILEKNPWRKQRALQFGFKVIEDESNFLFDLSFDTTSSSIALQFCIDQLKDEGTCINLSWYGDRKIELHLGGSFHYGRKKLISSQVSKIPLKMQDKWNYTNRKKWVMDLLIQYPYEKYITTFIPFKSAPTFYEQLRKGEQGEGLIWCLKY